MLIGLAGVKQPDGFETNKQLDIEISSKMSKSKPQTCIFIHDSKQEIENKLKNAYCPEKIIEGNPVLEYCKYIIFKKFKSMKIERPAKFGGDIAFSSYEELEKAYRDGLHPLDLKTATAAYLDKIISPIRKHFEKGKPKELYEFVKKQEVTR